MFFKLYKIIRADKGMIGTDSLFTICDVIKVLINRRYRVSEKEMHSGPVEALKRNDKFVRFMTQIIFSCGIFFCLIPFQISRIVENSNAISFIVANPFKFE